MDDFASSAWKNGEVAEETSLPTADFVFETLLERSGLDAEFGLFCRTLAAV